MLHSASSPAFARGGYLAKISTAQLSLPVEGNLASTDCITQLSLVCENLRSGNFAK